LTMQARGLLAGGFLFLTLGGALQAGVPARLEGPVQVLKAIGPEGKGNAEASAAWKQVASAPLPVLPGLLEAMDGANDYALNWLRSAVESVEDRGRKAGGKIPVAAVEEFLRDTRHHPRARRARARLLSAAGPRSAPQRRADPGAAGVDE